MTAKSWKELSIVGYRGRELTWKPTVADAGIHPVEIVVVDSEGGEVNQTFELTVASEAPAAPAP